MTISDNLAPAVERVIAILREAPALKEANALFRFGSLPREEMHSASPTVYVTPADRAEVSRESFAGRGSSPAAPPQKIAWELWVRVLADGPTPESIQKTIESLTAACVERLSGNVRLADPKTGADPLCATSRTYVQGALVRQRGTLLEGRTIRLRIFAVRAYAPSISNQ